MRRLCLVVVSLLLLLSLQLTATTSATASKGKSSPPQSSKAASAVRQNIARMPMVFEPYQQQSRTQADYLARAAGYQIALTSAGARLALPGAEMRLELLGADRDARGEALERQTGVHNYIIGRDARNWRTGIPTYLRVKYAAVYPGVDVIYYGNQQNLEYDFVVAPRADAHAVHMRLSGAERARLDANGNLVLTAAGRELRLHRPVAYQAVDGKRRAVAANYRLRGDDIAFELGPYDHRRELVIDPVLTYATYLGGSGFDAIMGVALDRSGIIHVAGSTMSTDFPGSGATHPRDVFVSEFDEGGAHERASTIISGSSDDFAQAMALDSAGNTFVAGITESSDFAGAQHVYGSLDFTPWGFVVELDQSGTLVTSALFGGASLIGVALDSSNNIYVGGGTESPSAPTTTGAFQTTFTGLSDAYVAKLSPDMSKLLYGTFLGASSSTVGLGLAVDGTGNAYMMGTTRAADFPTTAGAYQRVNHSPNGESGDVFVTKLNPSGSALVYSTLLGGNSDEDQNNLGGIAIDGSGNAYITGDTFSSDFPTTSGAFQTSASGFDAFVTKLNASGTALVYSTLLHGNSGPATEGHRIAVDSSGNAYVAGTTGDPTFPIHGGFDDILRGPFIGQGQNDVFVAKFSPDGHQLLYSSYLGGTGFDDNVFGVSLDANRNFYVAGDTNSSDFPVAVNAFQKTYAGGFDGFFAQIASLPCALNSTVPSETICTPTNGTTVNSPVRVIAGAHDNKAVKQTQIYLDGTKVYDEPLAAISTPVTMSPGTHRLTVQAIDTANTVFKSTINVTAGGGGTCQTSGAARSATICAPHSPTTTPVHFLGALHPGSSPTTVAQIYVDGVKKYDHSAASLPRNSIGDIIVDTTLSIPAGTHRFTLQGLDSQGRYALTIFQVQVQ
jgi:hypothetical protein